MSSKNPAVTSYVVGVRCDHQNLQIILVEQTVTDKPTDGAIPADVSVQIDLIGVGYTFSSAATPILAVTRHTVYVVLLSPSATVSVFTVLVAVFEQTVDNVGYGAEPTRSKRAEGVGMAIADLNAAVRAFLSALVVVTRVAVVLRNPRIGTVSSARATTVNTLKR